MRAILTHSKRFRDKGFLSLPRAEHLLSCKYRDRGGNSFLACGPSGRTSSTSVTSAPREGPGGRLYTPGPGAPSLRANHHASPKAGGGSCCRLGGLRPGDAAEGARGTAGRRRVGLHRWRQSEAALGHPRGCQAFAELLFYHLRNTVYR